MISHSVCSYLLLDVFISATIDNFNMLKPVLLIISHSIFSYLVYVDVFISAPIEDFNMLIPVLLMISFNQYVHVCLGDVFISDPLITSFFFLCHFLLMIPMFIVAAVDNSI